MELYTVEKIVGKRVRKGGIIEYKVKWLNYDEQDCTWQPVKNLQYVSQMVKAYDEELQKDQPLQKRQRKPIPQPNYKQHMNEQEIADNEEYEQEQNQLNKQPGQHEENEQDKQNQFEEQEDEEEKAQKNNPKEKQTQRANWDDDEVPDFDIDLQSLSLGDEQQLKTRQQIEHISAPRKKQKHEEQKLIRKTPQTSILKSKAKKPLQQVQKKSYLQQVQQRTRFIVKAPPKKKSVDQIPRSPKPKQLQVLQISRCNKTNEFIYLTQFGDIITYRRHADMKRSFPDQLIRFYQSKIQFLKIPKLSKVI